MTKYWNSLAELGWNDFIESLNKKTLEEKMMAPDRVIARVIGEERDLFHMANADGSFFGVVAGRLRYLADDRLDLPAIGDWVLCSHQSESERAVIHSIIPRQTCVKRKEAGRGIADQILAVNVDCALIVTSANAELNPARLQRYLTAVQDGGVNVEVVFSKIDLNPDYESSQFGFFSS